jgi:hypothetical protein
MVRGSPPPRPAPQAAPIPPQNLSPQVWGILWGCPGSVPGGWFPTLTWGAASPESVPNSGMGYDTYSLMAHALGTPIERFHGESRLSSGVCHLSILRRNGPGRNSYTNWPSAGAACRSPQRVNSVPHPGMERSVRNAISWQSSGALFRNANPTPEWKAYSE